MQKKNNNKKGINIENVTCTFRKKIIYFYVSTLVMCFSLTCMFHSLLGTKEDLRKTSLVHTNDNTDTKTSNSIHKKVSRTTCDATHMMNGSDTSHV